jgi:hypothetical protein
MLFAFCRSEVQRHGFEYSSRPSVERFHTNTPDCRFICALSWIKKLGAPGAVVSTLRYEKKKILIWGKTYPELSTAFIETVCTAGVTEDGTPIRLYPIHYRYLDEEDKFKKYQWITARLARNLSDPRPESYKIDCESIDVGELIGPDDYEWGARAEIVFRNPAWQFDTVDALLEDQKQQRISIGAVSPREILKVEYHKRSENERVGFQEKMNRLRRKAAADAAQLRLFDDYTAPQLKKLEFVDKRIQVHWLCQAPDCPAHTMQILDWEALELQRRLGEEEALQKVRATCDLSKFAIRFFLGNMRLHPTAFSIGGIWYPKRAPRLLFT